MSVFSLWGWGGREHLGSCMEIPVCRSKLEVLLDSEISTIWCLDPQQPLEINADRSLGSILRLTLSPCTGPHCAQEEARNAALPYLEVSRT